MARILFLIRKLEGGGAERQLLVAADGLGKLGHDVTIASWVGGGPYERDVNKIKAKYIVLDKRGPVDLVGFTARAARLARSINPHAVHGYMDSGNFFAAAVGPFVSKARIAWGIRGSELDVRSYDLVGRGL